MFIEFSGTSAKDAEELIDKLCERVTVTALNPYTEASHTGLSLNVALNKNEHNLKRLLLSGDIETNPGPLRYALQPFNIVFQRFWKLLFKEF